MSKPATDNIGVTGYTNGGLDAQATNSGGYCNISASDLLQL